MIAVYIVGGLLWLALIAFLAWPYYVAWRERRVRNKFVTPMGRKRL